MVKIETQAKLIAYKVTKEENMLIGGFGICDECNAEPDKGYLVPVLNHFQCSKCFKDFSKRAINYPEDAHIELRRAQYYEAMIPMTKEV